MKVRIIFFVFNSLTQTKSQAVIIYVLFYVVFVGHNFAIFFARKHNFWQLALYCSKTKQILTRYKSEKGTKTIELEYALFGWVFGKSYSTYLKLWLHNIVKPFMNSHSNQCMTEAVFLTLGRSLSSHFKKLGLRPKA